MPQPLLIADVPWLLYRAHFALPSSITDSKGRPVNALLGTVNALLIFYERRLPAPAVRGVIACLGAEEASYRVQAYPPYHAHRDPMPKDLRRQWEIVADLLTSFNWAVAETDTLEADDLMFSYAGVEARAKGSALLLTADRDLYAAVGKSVSVVEVRKAGREISQIGPAEVRERYGVEPEQVPDFIALRGDPSDGIPGAPGVGAKTAAELLVEHGTLEAVLDAAGRVKTQMRPRLVSALTENAELLRTFKHIATMQTIDVQRPPDAEPDFAAGASAAARLGMKGLSERAQKMAEANATA